MCLPRRAGPEGLGSGQIDSIYPHSESADSIGLSELIFKGTHPLNGTSFNFKHSDLTPRQIRSGLFLRPYSQLTYNTKTVESLCSCTVNSDVINL